MAPFTGWQRIVAKLLPWFDPDEAVAHERRTDEIVEKVGLIPSIRIAYSQTGNRLERRKRAR